MNDKFDVHPDMSELILAKEAAAKSAATNGARLAWNAYGASMSRPYPSGMSVSDKNFPSSRDESARIPVRIYRPPGVSKQNSCVLYLHGGAFIMGSLDSGDAIAWGIADQVRATVISVDYRLAPEHPFPAGIDDCYSVLSYVAANGANIDVDA